MIFRRVAMLVLLCAVAGAAELKLPLVWTVNCNTLLESGPTLADINGDGVDEILAAGREELFALDGSGNELWRWRTKARFMTYPSVLHAKDVTLIYVADTGGLFTCLDGAGKVVWQRQLKGPASWSASVVCDLDGDGLFEVVQTDDLGGVSAFGALDGKMVWQAKVNGLPVSPAVGDIDGDGKAEIAVATGSGNLALLRHDGTVAWEKGIGAASPSWATSAPILFADSEGHGRIAASAAEGKLLCLDVAGNVLWSYATRGAVASTISAGDIDLDGRADLFVITQLGVVYRFDESGRAIWDLDMQGRSLAAGAIADIDSDGHLEYVLCTQDGHLMAMNAAGETRFDWQFDNRTINVTPALGDIGNASPGLEMVITGGESGKVFCFGTPAHADAVLQWPAYRCDEHKTGAWFGLAQHEAVQMVPRNLAWDEVVAGEPVRFAVTNPKPGAQPLLASAACVYPDNSKRSATTKVVGARGELLLPIEATLPGAYRFTWTLSDSSGKDLFQGERVVALQPFANERAIVAHALDAMDSTAGAVKEAMPLSASALRREAVLIQYERDALTPLQEASPATVAAGVQETFSRTASLVARARRMERVARAIHEAAASKLTSGLIAFEGPVWENRGVDELVPERAASPLAIARRVVPGEHEPVAVKLFNTTDRELLVRVLPDKLPSGVAVTIHRTTGVPTSLGQIAWDALPEAGDSGLLSVPSLSTREAWLDVVVDEKAAGDLAFNVQFLAVNGPGVLEGPSNPRDVPPPIAPVSIALHVLPFAMAPSGSFRLCTWAAPEGAQVDDLLAHGNNVFVAPLPVAQYDAQGKLGASDFSKLEPIVKRFQGHDVVLLLSGMPALKPAMGDAAYDADLKPYLDELVAKLGALGLDAQHFALYPIDEPGGAGWDAVNKVVAFGKAVHAARNDVMVYIDGGGELPMYEAMAPYVDIWTPSLYMLAEDLPEMRVARASGKTLWSYNCGYGYGRPIGGDLRNINIVAEYRDAALFAFRYGGTGIGFWCYNIGGDGWSRMQIDYMMVYAGLTRPVTSRRWEAVREGIEDERILAALRDRAAGLGQDARSAEVKERVRHLIDVSLPAIIDQSFKEMKLGLARNVLDASNNDAIVDAFRKEMLDCVEAVAGLDGASMN